MNLIINVCVDRNEERGAAGLGAGGVLRRQGGRGHTAEAQQPQPQQTQHQGPVLYPR